MAAATSQHFPVDMPSSPTSSAAMVMSRAEKDKRNERDRRLRERKRHALKEMRALLTRLERQKQQLEATQRQVSAYKPIPTPMDEAKLLQQLEDIEGDPQQQYLQLLEQVEHLRIENHRLSQRLSQRELAANAVDALLMHEQTRIRKETKEQQTPCLEDQSPPPLSSDEVEEIVDILHVQIARVLDRVRKMQRFTQVEFGGWSDLRCDFGPRIDFAVKKTFEHETAASLCAKTWRIFTSGQMMRCMSPSLIPCEPRADFYGPDVALTWGGNDSPYFGDAALFARTQTEGRACIALTSFNLATIMEDMTSTNSLKLPGYWLFEDIPGNDEHPPRATVQFGGSMLNENEMVLRWLVSELVFIVVRWELIGVRPPMLTWNN